MLAIKNNIMAANAARHLGSAYNDLARSVERLSSGLRINSAKDDAAGLAVRELIRADVAVLQQGSRNAQDGISMLQTMEGAMSVIDENLIRMKELAEQAATGSYSVAQRAIMNSEFAEMAAEIDRIAGSTTFNSNALLEGTGTTVAIHVGTSDTIGIASTDMTTSSDGLNITVGTAGYQALADHGVSGASNAWLTLNDTNVGDETANILNISFNGEQSISIAFTCVGAAETFSLTEVVEAINDVTYNLDVLGDGTVQAYAMASVSHNNTSGLDYLKLDSRSSSCATMTLTFDSDANTTISDGFELAKNQAATSMAETTDNSEDDGRMVVSSGTGISIDTTANAILALDRITSAITEKDEARAEFGYKMNRLESTIAILNNQTENLRTAESRISDVDVATEMANLTKNQVLAQAGISMLAQANSMPQMALTLLR